MVIDTTFNMFSDTPKGCDPDQKSPTLRRYHRLLWSRQLPSGFIFQLDEDLCHSSPLGQFSLSSDAITHSYKSHRRTAHIIAQLEREEKDALFSSGSTIASYIVFPSKRVNGKATINGARGMNAKIGDRFDLTLECIRRHYRNETSPLSEALGRYADFFQLFVSFEGYVDFFLLGDLVDASGSVKFYLPFDDFRNSPFPNNLNEYREYWRGVLKFIEKRNQRIEEFSKSSQISYLEVDAKASCD